MFEVPNLDDLSTEAKDYDTAANVFATLSCYATQKATAVSYRKAGMIREAMLHEQECERIYKRLPDWAKW